MLRVARVDHWMAVIDDRPGALADTLEQLAQAGINLEFILARRSGQETGKGLVFVTPLEGASQIEAAEKIGFHLDSRIQGLRVEGVDGIGMAGKVTRAISAEGINLRGLSAGGLGGQCVVHLSFDSATDADRAHRILSQEL